MWNEYVKNRKIGYTVSFLIGVSSAYSCIGGSVSAQTASDIPIIETLVPLGDYLARADNERIEAYPYLRCAGLFLGHKYYAGANFDADTTARIDANIRALRVKGGLLTLDRNARLPGIEVSDISGFDIELLAQEQMLQVQSFAFFYDDRMKNNFLAAGSAFSQDELISGDLGNCQHFGELARDLGE